MEANIILGAAVIVALGAGVILAWVFIMDAIDIIKPNHQRQNEAKLPPHIEAAVREAISELEESVLDSSDKHPHNHSNCSNDWHRNHIQMNIGHHVRSFSH